ncbi:hypothetical protein BU17DRAFT_49226 [Hysterangium stoloniferum]|nr:hypothetical protein BU17DRAFT_49226 [Hysterangium stoloniferum]
MDSDGTGSVQFPTFVSAISTTSDNDDSTTSMNDSFDSDSSIRAEEEDLILAEEQRAKVRRELLNGEESWHMEKRKWDHLKNNNNWEIRPRKRSVGPDETGSGTDSESESDMEVDEEEEEEGEGDEDDDPDIRYGRGMVTGWQSSDDDDELDVELFFATLTDSSAPGSDADAEDGEDSGNETDSSDISTISMTEAAAVGRLRPSFGSECPLVVTEDWDGRLVFANGLKDGQGVLDVHFEVNAAQRQRTICETMDVDVDEEAQDVDHDDEDVFVSEDDGDTTDDILDDIATHGAAPLPPRCPTPPVHSIDPLSTVSPIVGSRRSKHLKVPLTVESPKPADILASAGKIFWEGADKDSPADRSRSASLAAASPSGTSVSSSQSRQPRMGNFTQISSDPKRRVIVDGTSAVLVSPFASVRRVRRGREIKRNDFDSNPSKRPRQSSLPGESLTVLQAEPDEPDEAMVQSSPELPLPTSIGLDDVLDASFLDSDASASASETTVDAHLRNLTRWDRVPMGTFRRSRTAHIGMLSSMIPPNDGVSYGSAGGHVLRKAPGGAALWQRDQKQPPGHLPGSVTVSPVIFPVRDGEKAPIIIRFDDPPILTQSRPPKRKDKRRRTRATNNSPFATHAPPAIVPPLSL